MWVECIRYRFRTNADQSCLELAQVAALKGLRNSPRCRSWRVLPNPDDPSACILAIEWDPETLVTPFRGTPEFAELHAALGEQVRALEEADYSADTQLLRRMLGGTEALFRLAEDILAGIMLEPDLQARFASEDGSKQGRLGLWLLEVLGGPDLFSSSFPDAIASEGPMSAEPLDLDDRALLLEVAQNALPSLAGEHGRCVLGALRAHLPLHPSPRGGFRAAYLLESGAVETEPAPPARRNMRQYDRREAHDPEIESGVRPRSAMPLTKAR
jgi:hypothetical protein